MPLIFWDVYLLDKNKIRHFAPNAHKRSSTSSLFFISRFTKITRRKFHILQDNDLWLNLSLSGQHQHEADLIGAGGAEGVRPLPAERLRGNLRVRRRRRDRPCQDSGRAGRCQAAAEREEVHSDAADDQGQWSLRSLQHHVSRMMCWSLWSSVSNYQKLPFFTT